ncbi:MAG: hypothetical protein XU10_C0006G0050 [Chloroflexi bacterium CSP1-4]|nr:MAG: hypothetical protein XU10_C0006G0050 [Chloroflexi bacterium CSP1-4]
MTRRFALLVAVLGLVFGASVAGPVAGAATSVTFEAPSVEVRFGQAITWSQGFGSATPPARVELMTRLTGTETWFVQEVQAREVGQATTGGSAYRVDFIDGGFYLPNGVIDYRFRVTTPDGVVDGPRATVRIEDDRVTWKTLEGDVVRIHWYEGSEAFARRALRFGEEAVASASALLGVTETEPIDFYVYGDPTLLQTAIGPNTKEFVAGRAIAEIRTLFGAVAPDQIGSDWVPVLITHELTHLVFDTATQNVFHDPPHWLNEGLATYLSEGFGSGDRQRVANAIERGTLLPLDALASGFPQAREELFYLGYAEGTAAVDFFIRRYSEAKLVDLIRSYADGVTDDEAFRAATGAGIEAFGQAWLEDIGAREPKAYGPQPPAPGPTPADWAIGGGSATPAPTEGSGGPTPSATPGPDGGGAAQTGFLVGVIVAALFVIAAGVIVVIVRRGRPASSAAAPPAGPEDGP